MNDNNDKKAGTTSWVLVCDVTDNGKLYYYMGYFTEVYFGPGDTPLYPNNTNDYVFAMKIPFKDEAQHICDEINKLDTPYKYHVEGHQYM